MTPPSDNKVSSEKKSSRALQTQIQARQTPNDSHWASRKQNNIRTKIFSYEMKVWLVFPLQLNNLSLVSQSSSLSSSHPSQQTETGGESRPFHAKSWSEPSLHRRPLYVHSCLGMTYLETVGNSCGGKWWQIYQINTDDIPIIKTGAWATHSTEKQGT